MKHLSNCGKVPFGQFDTSIFKILLYKVSLTNCSWSAHISMKSALLTKNPCYKNLFVDRNSCYGYLTRKEHLVSLQKHRLFPPLMLHIFKSQVVYPIHNIETQLFGKF